MSDMDRMRAIANGQILSVDDAFKLRLREIASRGGKATGVKKRRSPEHYARMKSASDAAKKAKRGCPCVGCGGEISHDPACVLGWMRGAIERPPTLR